MQRRQFFAATAASLGTFVLARAAQAAQPQYSWIFVSDMHCSACARKKLSSKNARFARLRWENSFIDGGSSGRRLFRLPQT